MALGRLPIFKAGIVVSVSSAKLLVVSRTSLTNRVTLAPPSKAILGKDGKQIIAPAASS
jgi:hypothetical protein